MCDRHFKDMNPNIKIKSTTTSDKVSAVASNGVLCVACEGTKHVCENHSRLPWGGTSDSKGACTCGGAGMLCPECG